MGKLELLRKENEDLRAQLYENDTHYHVENLATLPYHEALALFYQLRARALGAGSVRNSLHPLTRHVPTYLPTSQVPRGPAQGQEALTMLHCKLVCCLSKANHNGFMYLFFSLERRHDKRDPVSLEKQSRVRTHDPISNIVSGLASRRRNVSGGSGHEFPAGRSKWPGSPPAVSTVGVPPPAVPTYSTPGLFTRGSRGRGILFAIGC